MMEAFCQPVTSDDTPLLRVAGLSKHFGGVYAVAEVDFAIHRGEIVGVIGPNGAGKSTLIGLLSGAHRADAGSICFDGTDITATDPAFRARHGIACTHQVPRPFADMTVLENLLIGRYYGAGVDGPARARNDCLEILERTGLGDLADAPAGQLQILNLKRLELARAVALRPRLLLLDEIGAGLVEREVQELIELILTLRKECEAVLIVEHVLDVIRQCCDQAIALNFGRVIVAGTPRGILAHEVVAAAYLGTSAADPASAGTEPCGIADAGARPAIPAAGSVRSSRPVRLSVEHVEVDYGGVRALRDVSLEVREREVVALLGANGAGKTSLARAVSGSVRVAAGSIVLEGREIQGRQAPAAATLGVAHCMEGRRIFGHLSVEENLLLGAMSAGRAERSRRLEHAYALFPELVALRNKSGKALSGGQQQMLAITRALMAAPKLIIFDEISLGLAPIVVRRLYEILAQLRSAGLAMLLIEQNIERALAFADWAYVLARGEVRLAGPPDALRAGPELAHLYLGQASDSNDDRPH